MSASSFLSIATVNRSREVALSLGAQIRESLGSEANGRVVVEDRTVTIIAHPALAMDVLANAVSVEGFGFCWPGTITAVLFTDIVCDSPIHREGEDVMIEMKFEVLVNAR